MFLTLEHAEVPLGALVKGAHSWRYVEYLTSQPWFYVMALEHVEGIARPATLLIKALEDLLELEGVDNDAWEITRVHLVSPGHLNGTEDWKMERLKEIAKIKNNGNSSLLYLLHSGVIYFENRQARSYLSNFSKEVLFRQAHDSET
ncbi:hypothetical protein [Pseudomonas chlororaphis]|uniref:hypothetical protein n=1 Tax=Pseudomonas chlororaphis TaxID=587753 RepID=UPI000F56D4D5|nr:hypothetical protein [Pseudomonas chlororaphis]AZC95870.1 hypothetical protein C4K28_3142 [Pseudomonas chlororaphis subsp. piscium]